MGKKKTLNKEEVYKEYQKLRNQVRSSTRKAHKQYEKEIVRQIKGNPKKFWLYTQSKLKTKTNIPNFIADDGDGNKITLEKDSDKAEALSNFFSSVFTREPEGDIPAPKTRCNKQINAPKINQDIVQKKLSQLKKSPKILGRIIYTHGYYQKWKTQYPHPWQNFSTLH